MALTDSAGRALEREHIGIANRAGLWAHANKMQRNAKRIDIDAKTFRSRACRRSRMHIHHVREGTEKFPGFYGGSG